MQSLTTLRGSESFDDIDKKREGIALHYLLSFW